MKLLQSITKLDHCLFAELAKADAMNEEFIAQLLAERAQLLHELLQGELLQSEILITADESSELIARSRKLKETAEQLQQQLGEQLKKMNKGRRSVQAYQTVKRN